MCTVRSYAGASADATHVPRAWRLLVLSMLICMPTPMGRGVPLGLAHVMFRVVCVFTRERAREAVLRKGTLCSNG